MIKQKIENCRYTSQILKAQNHQKYIQLFIETQVSDNKLTDVAGDRIVNSTLERVWNDNNPFSTWLSGWMRPDNLRSYLKFMRLPFPTVSLAQDEIEPQMRKVFDGQNSNFDYEFTNDTANKSGIQFINEQNFDEFISNEYFNELFYRHNSILVTDMDSVVENLPVRLFVDISQVVAIDLKKNTSEIEWLIWKDYGRKIIDDVEYVGDIFYHFSDGLYEVYIQNEGEYILIESIPHDLGSCPAVFVSPTPLNSENKVVRKNIFFSNKLDKLEEFVLYRTLLKMTGVNGAFPIISMYKPNKKPCGFKTEQGSECRGGIIYVNNQLALEGNAPKRCPSCNADKFTAQAGTIVGLPAPTPPKGVDPKDWKPIDLNANFMKFHYVPTDILEWLNDYVKQLENDIYYAIVGKDRHDSVKKQINKEQVNSQNETFRNVLRAVSRKLSVFRKKADEISLKLRYGNKFKSASINYGDSFLIHTEGELYEMKNNSTNPVDKKDLQEQIISVKFRNDSREKQRQLILFNLLPYATMSDEDFLTKVEFFNATDVELRLNFNDYIEQLETTASVIEIYKAEGMKVLKKMLSIMVNEKLNEKPYIYSSLNNVNNNN